MAFDAVQIAALVKISKVSLDGRRLWICPRHHDADDAVGAMAAAMWGLFVHSLQDNASSNLACIELRKSR